ncbi:unnamed protein product, partial [Mesorhabditis belari]|uniref:C-type lectin domain-containing protein n=1 Tax=Mesorhabditis belari TaxID=2138241 RepID=A0AAF3JA86_9BILA
MFSAEEKFQITIRLQHFFIIGLENTLQLLKGYVQLQMLWVDPRLSWEPSEYGGIEMIYVTCNKLWIPDEVIVSSISTQEIYDHVQKAGDCKIYANGTVEQGRTLLVDLVCIMDIQKFPFDYQQCGLSFSSQVYPWHHYNLKGELFTKYNVSCMRVSFNVLLRRRPHFYIYVIGIPCFLLTFLSVTGCFWTANVKEEQLSKLGIALTSMMSMTTFVNIISQEMPKTSHFPLLGSYVLTCISITSMASLILVIFPEKRRIQVEKIKSIFIGIRGFSCPTGSFQSPNEDLCIYAISDVDFYSDAVQQCSRLGGNVVKIKNIFENAFLLGLIGSIFPAGQAPYIGVVKLSNGTWVYSDGTPLIYANWAPGEPSDAQGLTSAVMDPQSGRWKAADPTALRPFFCGVDGDLFQCPNNWNYFEATDSCYYLQNFTAADEANFTLYLWPDAEKLCVNAGAHLASIHSKEENDFVSGECLR